jgi:hypothetical protein
MQAKYFFMLVVSLIWIGGSSAFAARPPLSSGQGLAFEPCLAADGTPYTSYIFLDHGNFILFGNTSWAVDPTGANPASSPTFFEYAENANCQGTTCTALGTAFILGQNQSQPDNVSWTDTYVSDQMDTLTLNSSTENINASCSGFPVKGQACKDAVKAMVGYLNQYGITLSKINLTDSVCD